MQVSIEEVTGLERRMTIDVPAAQVDDEVADRLQKAARTVRIDGFRKGKVPIKVLRQRFGKGIRQEVVGEVVSRSFQEAVVQEKIQTAGQPTIESVSDNPGEDLRYVASFEVYPEVELMDFAKLAISRPVAEVGDQDVDKMVDVLREQQSEWTVVDRAAQSGDQVKIDYTGRKDGEEFAGGKAEGSTLKLGSGQMIPGFEDGIVGMAAGETKTLSLTFPDDYQSDELKGAAVEFDINVHEVTERTLPELNDAFFLKFGVTEGGLEKFREDVRNNMERELRNAIKNKLKGRLMNQLLENHDLELPKALVQGEIQSLRRQMLQQFGGGQNFDESLLPGEIFSGEAEKRVALGLIVAKVIETENITVDNEQVKQQIEEVAATYEDPQEVVNYYYGNPQMLHSVESAVLEDQVVEHILQQATVAVEHCSYEEAVKPDQKRVDDDTAEEDSAKEA